jgi:hypothetical protein
VTIDGYTQGDGTPGDPSDDATENTLSQGTNAALKIQLNGSSAGAASGLTISAGNTTVKGLVNNRFGQYGILDQGDFFCTTNHGNFIQGNFIGTNPGGTAAGAGNGLDGVSICSKNNTVGGTSDAARNLISGNAASGVSIGGGGTSHRGT